MIMAGNIINKIWGFVVSIVKGILILVLYSLKAVLGILKIFLLLFAMIGRIFLSFVKAAIPE